MKELDHLKNKQSLSLIEIQLMTNGKELNKVIILSKSIIQYLISI